ncbi:MAG: orotidine-5'-phosphate decarboxylase [Thermoprotei archaeon]|nr:MAG: orotidine-5'-phosphate decarboxylase [Thermoprotei archaeon]
MENPLLIPKERGKYRIIVALDRVPMNKLGSLHQLVNIAINEASGIKIGLPLLLELGIERIKDIVSGVSDYEALAIADLKLADIGDIMVLILNKLARIGFNAIIAHSFTGCEDALCKLAKNSKNLGIPLIAVVSMSHKGAEEIMNPLIDKLLEIAINKAEVEGLVVPATRPGTISYVRTKADRKVALFAPGVGVQGAPFGSALAAGADYEIIGRSIVLAENPIMKLRDIARKQLELVGE